VLAIGANPAQAVLSTPQLEPVTDSFANARAVAGGSVLNANEVLRGGYSEFLRSTDGEFRLVMQSDGNLVLYAGGNRALWWTGTSGANNRLIMQPDGNLVVYSATNQPRWSTGTAGAGNRLAIQSDGNLVVYNSANRALWSTGTSSSVLRAGETLAGASSQFLRSPNGQFRLVMQADGNLVLYGPGNSVRWSTRTSGTTRPRLTVQPDGNLVVYDGGNTPRWTTATRGFTDPTLTLQDDGNAVLTAPGWGPVWSIYTGNLAYGPVDDYPAGLRSNVKNPNADPPIGDGRSYIAGGWCTSFVAWRLYSRNHADPARYQKLGHAITWADGARARGIPVDGTPRVGAVAWFPIGDMGHVAWVRAVQGNTVYIEEYNNPARGGAAYSYRSRTISAGSAQYIHF
jgi:surface antigen